MSATSFMTHGGVEVLRRDREIDYAHALDTWITRLDTERGAAFTSSYEFPGRYTRWAFALASPPLAIEAI
ncbi:MAG: hypothetical protein AAGF45_11115, partial [Pseudomonadota bacterium]